MITVATVALWLMQAPPGAGAGMPPVSAPAQEWSLGGAFKLKQEKFLRWQPVFDPFHPTRGWHAELRPTWVVELSPTHPRLRNFSLELESMPAGGSGVGIVRPKLQYRVSGTETRIGVEATVLSFFSSSIPRRGGGAGLAAAGVRVGALLS